MQHCQAQCLEFGTIDELFAKIDTTKKILFSIKEAMGHKSLSSTEVYLALGIGNGRSVKSPYDFD